MWTEPSPRRAVVEMRDGERIILIASFEPLYLVIFEADSLLQFFNSINFFICFINIT